MSSDQILGDLLYEGDYTTRLYRGHDSEDPYKQTTQYFMECHKGFEGNGEPAF